MNPAKSWQSFSTRYSILPIDHRNDFFNRRLGNSMSTCVSQRHIGVAQEDPCAFILTKRDRIVMVPLVCYPTL